MLGLLWLAIFSLLYTLGDESGAWRTIPVGRFRDLELFVGFAGGVLALVAVLRRSRQSRVPGPQPWVDRIG
ncbi:MAG TPA: hypothetical protein VK389_02455 [Thermoanaerobaculia bacterium]|nr:hypothetical protein [Thermoanaerobaculia bacterium]